MPRKKQQGNGSGTVYPRKNKDGKIVSYLGQYFDPNGKRRYVSAKHKGECREKLRAAMGEADKGLVYNAGTTTLSQYLDAWLKDSVKDTVRQRTYERYESIARVHIKPTLGRVKLKTLTPAQVRGLYRKKLDSGLAPRTVNYIHTTLHKALKDAVADGLIPRNATDAVKPPRPEKPEIRPLTQDQARTLLVSAKDDRYYSLYVLALHCGLREGELLGLKWEDVDLNTGKLSVRRTLSETRTGHRFEKPKNDKGRSVKLSQRTIDALRSHRTRQKGERQVAAKWEDMGLVFPTTTGTTMSCTNLLGRHFKPLLRRAGLPDIRLHDLRHTCATMLLKMGQHPKYVHELLGHANISITLDTYSHVIEGMGDGLADAMDGAL
jgi:integrase